MRVSNVRRKVLVVIASTLVAGAAAGCSSSQAASVGGVTTIRYQSYVGTVNLPELADALGYFDDFKLERVGDVQGGPENLRAVATNQVDYAGAFNGAIAKLASTGTPITAVLSYYGSSGDVSSSILVRDDGQVNGAKGLIGKKIAVNTLGANAEAVLDTYLVKEGLTAAEIDKVTLVPLPAINAESSLRKGQVDAAYMSSTAKEFALERSGLKNLVTDIDLVGPYNGGSYVLRDDFIAENPKVTRKFVAALAKTIGYTKTHSLDEAKSTAIDYLRALPGPGPTQRRTQSAGFAADRAGRFVRTRHRARGRIRRGRVHRPNDDRGRSCVLRGSEGGDAQGGS